WRLRGSIVRRGKEIAKTTSRIGQMAAGHDDGDARHRGNAVVRPVLDVREQHDLTLNRGESPECREQAGAQVGALQCPDGCIAACEGNLLIERDESPPAYRSQPVERPPLDDREQ